MSMNTQTNPNIKVWSPEDLNNIGFVRGQFICKHGGTTMNWCEHLQRTIQVGKDAHMLHPGVHVEVPMFPLQDVFVTVTIGDQLSDKVKAALMWMDFAPDVGRPYKVELGFWNDGEGLNSIRTVILDYVKSKLHPDENMSTAGDIVTKCPASLQHTPRNHQRMQKEAQFNSRWKALCLWNIAMEGACTICVDEMSGADPMNGVGNF